MIEITDEMVEKAKLVYEGDHPQNWCDKAGIRAALLAVLPDIVREVRADCILECVEYRNRNVPI